jgi:hypothetical protein
LIFPDGKDLPKGTLYFAKKTGKPTPFQKHQFGLEEVIIVLHALLVIEYNNFIIMHNLLI